MRDKNNRPIRFQNSQIYVFPHLKLMQVCSSIYSQYRQNIVKRR